HGWHLFKSFFADWLIRVNEELKAEGINADDELPPKTTKIEEQYTQVKLVAGDKIKFNELTKEIEFNGKSADFKNFKLKLARQFKIELKCSKEDLCSIVVEVAEENAYHPIRNYLDECHDKHSDTSILDNLAKRYFGTNNPLYQTFIRKTLIAAVARVYDPGCKVDTTLILQGGQGVGKSTFFKTLASDDWFCDDMGSPNGNNKKDEILKLHTAWLTEWGELEKIFSKSEVSDIKAFL
ncbi:VapE domain-containing protein, partial [Planktothrix sp.]|uniref:VapE domain-containing protein n=1 Tax=Planktothrix sp. TaxID=3088171 RepID=UPI0038D4B1EB